MRNGILTYSIGPLTRFSMTRYAFAACNTFSTVRPLVRVALATFTYPVFAAVAGRVHLAIRNMRAVALFGRKSAERVRRGCCAAMGLSPKVSNFAVGGGKARRGKGRSTVPRVQSVRLR